MSVTPEERAVDAIGWFTKTSPDSEDQQLLDDVAEAIRQAEAAARAEERERCLAIINRDFEIGWAADTDIKNWQELAIEDHVIEAEQAIRARND